MDALLQAGTPSGPAWRRYHGDGYGEHPGGRPYDGTGQGRPWRCSPESAATTPGSRAKAPSPICAPWRPPPIGWA